MLLCEKDIVDSEEWNLAVRVTSRHSSSDKVAVKKGHSVVYLAVTTHKVSRRENVTQMHIRDQSHFFAKPEYGLPVKSQRYDGMEVRISALDEIIIGRERQARPLGRVILVVKGVVISARKGSEVVSLQCILGKTGCNH